MEDIAKLVSFAADLVELILGLIALWALIFHRDKIGAFLKILAHALINERVKRLKVTLGALENMNYDVKEQRKEIFAVLGEIAGMIKGLAGSNAGFKNCYDEILRITEAKEALSEAKKRRISQEIHGLLDDEALKAAVTLTEAKNGS